MFFLFGRFAWPAQSWRVCGGDSMRSTAVDSDIPSDAVVRFRLLRASADDATLLAADISLNVSGLSS
ncbi:hypothetical protein CKO20_00595 [Rhodocyclus tenuis]|nr:hypothetical protein [Rhodocyclus tenuis]